MSLSNLGRQAGCPTSYGDVRTPTTFASFQRLVVGRDFSFLVTEDAPTEFKTGPIIAEETAAAIRSTARWICSRRLWHLRW